VRMRKVVRFSSVKSSASILGRVRQGGNGGRVSRMREKGEMGGDRRLCVLASAVQALWASVQGGPHSPNGGNSIADPGVRASSRVRLVRYA